MSTPIKKDQYISTLAYLATESAVCIKILEKLATEIDLFDNWNKDIQYKSWLGHVLIKNFVITTHSLFDNSNGSVSLLKVIKDNKNIDESTKSNFNDALRDFQSNHADLLSRCQNIRHSAFAHVSKIEKIGMSNNLANLLDYPMKNEANRHFQMDELIEGKLDQYFENLKSLIKILLRP